MIVLVYLIVLLRELLVSTIFALCIPTSPFIQLNDFYTCYIHIFVALRRKRSYAHAHVNATPHAKGK